MEQKPNYLRLYVAVLDEFPDYMTPTLVAHTMLSAHLNMKDDPLYDAWLTTSYRKCVIRVSQEEFDKISNIPGTHLGNENTTLEARMACAIPYPVWRADVPDVLKQAKLWSPK